MSDIRGLALLNPLLGGEYADKVVGYNPIAYWPLWENSGTTVKDHSGNGRDGTYANVALANTTGPDGEPAVRTYDATTIIDLYSVSLRDAFSGAEGTVAGWAKVSNAVIWVAGVQRHVATLAATVSNDHIFVYKAAAANTFTLVRQAGGVDKLVAITTSTLAWFHWAITWSIAADEVKVYYNGSQSGATQTTLAAWVNVLDVNWATLACDRTPVGASEWPGWLAHIAVWDTPLSATAIADLGTV